MAKSLTEIIKENRVEGEEETRIAAFRDNFLGVLSSGGIHGMLFTHSKGDGIIEECFSQFDAQVITEVPLGIRVTGCIHASHYSKGSAAYNKGEERLNYIGL